MGESKADMNNLHPCFETCRDAGVGVDPSILINNTCEICTAERQGHGKPFENRLVMHLMGPDIENKSGQPTNATISKHNDRSGHTDNHDFEFSRVDVNSENIPDRYNNSDGISIKFIKEKCSVCMGDAVNIFNNFQTRWSMLVGFYNDVVKNGIKCKCVKKIYLLNLIPDDVKIFFGDCCLDEVCSLKSFIINWKDKTAEGKINLRKETKPQKTKAQKNIKCGKGILSLAPKISSSNQRLQCAISGGNFKKLLTFLNDQGRLIEISKEEYPDLFKPIVPRQTKKGGKKKTQKANRNKKRKTNSKRKSKSKRKSNSKRKTKSKRK